MHLSKHDLFQMNDEWLKKLPAELVLEVSKHLLHDVKELQDRLNQNPDNSSRPPTSQAPWAETGDSEEQSGAADESDTADAGAAGATGSATVSTRLLPHRFDDVFFMVPVPPQERSSPPSIGQWSNATSAFCPLQRLLLPEAKTIL